MGHCVEECPKVCSWFRELGKDKEKETLERRIRLIKCKVLGKVERERKKRDQEKENGEKDN